MTKPTLLITGATSGIGKAAAKALAPTYRLILCGRRKAVLDELKRELSSLTEVHTLTFDVRDKQAVFAAIDSLPNEWSRIDALLNNAGNAHGLAPIQDGSVEDWDAMMDGNVKGLLYVSKPIIEKMKNQGSGHIINIGSIAGKEVYPNGNVYCASKFAVDALTQGMRMDLNPFGIKVTAIHPGLVETDFSLVRFKGDAERAASVYKGYKALQAEDIAETIRFVLSAPAHVVLSDIVILPTAQASATIVKKTL
ncbi:SDR family NAD(P)-dependent oxidoreductase [Cytophagales bacterium LB-30]|uniref:SDR family NAD(P)-dependent oxidoreductase n=1 Tax=Shiella aurantiaca TaxID=3058365 RepID=A0ABT8F998_9BACT|nr:SDR family NAD(P)-dependent oxidoreductase [Shiella aurantiaca]MDN4166939.1 SDR family NAD(P)-dependent oxidoreductase [Shiella aurantiaca]